MYIHVCVYPSLPFYVCVRVFVFMYANIRYSQVPSLNH